MKSILLRVMIVSVGFYWWQLGALGDETTSEKAGSAVKDSSSNCVSKGRSEITCDVQIVENRPKNSSSANNKWPNLSNLNAKFLPAGACAKGHVRRYSRLTGEEETMPISVNTGSTKDLNPTGDFDRQLQIKTAAWLTESERNSTVLKPNLHRKRVLSFQPSSIKMKVSTEQK